MDTLPANPPDLVVATTPTGGREFLPQTQPPSPPSLSTVSTQPSSPQPTTNSIPSLFEDQNKNRLPHSKDEGVKLDIDIEIDIGSNSQPPSVPNGSASAHEFIYEDKAKFYPSSPKDVEVLKNIRKVFIARVDDAKCSYTVSSEFGEFVFETVQGETNGGMFSRYFRQEQKVILVKDKFQHCVLKMDFGRSRTVSCCQTLRFAAMTAYYKSKWEEPLCVFFKDRGCCIYSCCSSGVTYESVPQLDALGDFTVKTKRQWRNRAEFMVKQNDGTILAFIDKEKKVYTLTMGENLKPTMKACLIGFVISMDIMDREDAGRLNCYLRPSTYVTILFLAMLFFMIGAFLFHFITAMILSWPKGGRPPGCTDEVHAAHDDPFLPYNHTQSTSPETGPHNLTVTPEI